MIADDPVEYLEPFLALCRDYGMEPDEYESFFSEYRRLIREHVTHLPHVQQARFYQRVFEDADPRLNLSGVASMASYHATMATL